MHRTGSKPTRQVIWDELDEIRKTIENKPSLSHAQVAQKVFKSKSRDRVVCFGGGITLKEITGPQPSRVELQTELTTAKNKIKILLIAWTRYKQRMMSSRDEWVHLKLN